MEKFIKAEIRILKKCSRGFIRFRDPELSSFNFGFSHNNYMNLIKLREGFSLVSFCLIQIQKYSDGEIEGSSVKKISSKLKNILGGLGNMKYDSYINESNVPLEYGKHRIAKKINSLIEENKIFIVDLFNFLELLRPLYVKPLGKYTAGVSSREYGEMMQEEGGDTEDQW